MSQPTPARIGAGGWARIAVRSLAIVLVLLAGLVLYCACRPFTRHNPAPRLFFAGVCRALGLRLVTHGEPRRKGAILLANHVSWLDIAGLCATSGSAFVAHDGLASHPVLRWLCRLNDTVFIARHDRGSVSRQVEQVREAIRDTGALTIFPEGTTGWGDSVPPFKSSLLSAISPVPDGLAVQPVLLDFGPDAPTIAWVGEEGGLANYLRIAARRTPLPLAIHFMPPLSGEALANRKTIATAARDTIAGRMEAVRTSRS